MVANANGALFKNDDKKKANHPDYKGNFTLTAELLKALAQAMGNSNELKVYLGAWLKEGKSGKYLSLSVNAPFEKNGAAPSRGRADLNDDPPF